MKLNKKTTIAILSSLVVILCLIVTLMSRVMGVGAVGAKAQGSSPLKNALSSDVQIAQAVRSGHLKLTARRPLPGIHPQLTCTKPPCVLPNSQASEGGQPVNETTVAVNPNNALDVLTAANDYNCGDSDMGLYASSDGGSTWKTNCMGVETGQIGCGDPGVGYDLNNTAYAVSLEDCGSNAPAASSIVFEKSTDNGTTWNTPSTVVNPIFSGGDVDKPYLAIDDNSTSPHANTLYLSTTQFDYITGTQISVSHSTDGGATWTTSRVEPETGYGVVDQFSTMTIGKDGTVYISWMRCFENSSKCANTVASLYFAKSTDGGNTWSSPTFVGYTILTPDDCPSVLPCFYGGVPNTSERVANVPVIGVDNTTGKYHGYLYIAFYTWTGNYMAVEVATSVNGGATWGAAVPVGGPNATHDQFFPWLSVNAKGTVGVTWLDRRDDPQNISYKTYFTYSTNGGATFAADKSLSTTLSNPFNDGFGGVFMGDYTGNAWNTSTTTPTLYASWPDTRNTVTAQDEIGGYIQ